MNCRSRSSVGSSVGAGDRRDLDAAIEAMALRIHLDELAAVGAADDRVVAGLEAGLSRAVHAHETQQVCRKLESGVIALALGRQDHARELQRRTRAACSGETARDRRT